jgi:hypothetical protein
MNLLLRSHDLSSKTENREGEDIMSQGQLRLGTIGLTALMSVAAFCLDGSSAAAGTGKPLSVGMSIWGATGLMIIASLGALTLAERAAAMLRRAPSSQRMTVQFRSLAYKS